MLRVGREGGAGYAGPDEVVLAVQGEHCAVNGPEGVIGELAEVVVVIPRTRAAWRLGLSVRWTFTLAQLQTTLQDVRALVIDAGGVLVRG